MNQDPQGQFESPYLYAFNNPVASIDPDGEFAFFLGAMIAGGITAALSNPDAQLKDIFSGVIMAGLVSGFGQGFGPIAKGTGFWNGAVNGSVQSAVSGFVSGSLSQNQSESSFFEAGLKGAGIGALTGGLLGGVSGGLDALQNDRDFWSGELTTVKDEVGGAALRKGDHFLKETIPAGSKPTSTGQIAKTPSNPDYGKYGWTRNNGHKMHKGVDYSGAVGDDVHAMFGGTVTYNSPSSSYGKHFVRIESNIGKKIYNVDYGHLSTDFVKVGDVIKPGQTIGLMGRLGNLAGTSYPTHVHVSVFRMVKVNGLSVRGFVKPSW